MFFTCQFAKVTTRCKMPSKVARMLISPSVALWRGCGCSWGFYLEHDWQMFPTRTDEQSYCYLTVPLGRSLARCSLPARGGCASRLRRPQKENL